MTGRELAEHRYLRYLLWLAFNDEEFMVDFAGRLQPAEISDQYVAWLLTKASGYYLEYGELMPEEALELELDTFVAPKGFDKDDCAEAWAEADGSPVPPGGMRDYLANFTKTFFVKKATERALASAANLIELGQTEQAIALLGDHKLQTLSMQDDDGLGDDLLLDSEAFLQEVYERFKGGTGTGIPTGIHSIDGVLRGGLRAGELGIVIAPPGHGKSQWLSFVARNAFSEGYNVVVYTLEMDSTQIQTRIWAGLLDINVDDFGFRFDEVKNDITGWINGWNELHPGSNHLIVKRWPTRSASVDDIRAHLAQLERKQGFVPDLIVIDYADILVGKKGRRFDQRRDEQANIYEDIRALAQDSQIAVWTASQANRLSLKKELVSLEHIADSWDKAKIADFVIAFHQAKQDDDPTPVSEIKMNLAKVRNNRAPAPVELGIDFGRSMFVDHGFAQRVA